MNNVSKTLYIPLYGKSLVSRKGILLHDPKAEEIWAAEGFPLKGKSRSRWLAYHMGMRAAVFDRWVAGKISEHPKAVVLHIGCGMDSRSERVARGETLWFDMDFPDVIEQRRKYHRETETCRMLGADIRDAGWLSQIPGNRRAIVVMEGVSMYLRPEELRELMGRLCAHFSEVSVLMDCYSRFAAKASRYKNPIRDVGVSTVYGMDDPEIPGLTFQHEHDMTPEDLIRQLAPWEQRLFRRLYAGAFAKKLYRIYEYEA